MSSAGCYTLGVRGLQSSREAEPDGSYALWDRGAHSAQGSSAFCFPPHRGNSFCPGPFSSLL